MFRVVLMLCAASIWVYSVTGLNVPEKLQFQCISNATNVNIEIDTELDSSNSICQDRNTTCTGIEQPTGSAPAKLIACPTNQAITIVVTMSSDRSACGGDGARYFNLYCLTGLDMGTVVNHSIAVHRNQSIVGLVPSPKEEYEMVDLDMTFYKNEHGDALDNTVTIGTVVYVLISSPHVLKLKVEKCTAYSKSENLQLLDSSGNYTAANKNGVLLERFSKSVGVIAVCSGGTCWLSRLYAFHFKTSMEVSLECYINVCLDAACKTSRRRRHISNSDRHVVRASLHVHDNYDIEDRSSGRHLGLPIVLTTPLAVLFVFMGYI